MIKIKAGVEPRLLVIAAAVANVAEELGLTLVITSGTDGKHKRGSKHYTSEALDVRSKNLTKAQQQTVLARFKSRLGPSYDCILEPDHFHLEFDPK